MLMENIQIGAHRGGKSRKNTEKHKGKCLTCVIEAHKM